MSLSPIQPTTIYTTANDSAPTITFTLQRVDGSVIDLTGTTVTFLIKDPRTGSYTNVSTDSCALFSPTNGQCTYSWTHGGTDCPEAGTYAARLRITYANGTRESAAVTIIAGDDI